MMDDKSCVRHVETCLAGRPREERCVILAGLTGKSRRAKKSTFLHLYRAAFQYSFATSFYSGSPQKSRRITRDVRNKSGCYTCNIRRKVRALFTLPVPNIYLYTLLYPSLPHKFYRPTPLYFIRSVMRSRT